MARSRHFLLCLSLALLASATAGAAEFTATRFRFKPTKLRSNATTVGTGFQMSEFRFVRNGVQVPWGTATLTAANGTVIANEPVNNIKDGSVGTAQASSKWYSAVTVAGSLPSFYATFPSATTIDSYAFATANDSSDRDPVSWELAYTNVTTTPVEADWVKIDVRTDYPTTTNRYSWNPDLTVPFELPPVINSFVATYPIGATDLNSSVVLNGTEATLLWSGTGATEYSVAPAPGVVDGTECSLVPPANADTEYTLSATNTIATLTAKRTLRAVAGGTAAYKFIRFRPLKVRGSPSTAIQIADFICWANLSDGIPGNQVEVKPAAARTQTGLFTEAASEGPNKLKDGVSTTKWYSATLVNVIFDMRDTGGNAMPFDTYKMTMANDFFDRDPLRWVLEGADTDTATVWNRIDDLSLFDFSPPATRFETVTVPLPGASLPPLSTFTADAVKVIAGEPLTFTWTSSDAVQVTITPDLGTVAASGSATLFPTVSATYTMTASSPAGFTTVKTFPVTVVPTAPATIDYPNFNAEAGELSLCGVSAVVNDFANIPLPGNFKRLRLTPDVAGQSGSAWFGKRVPTALGFDTTFSFQLNKPLNTLTGADGFSFVVHDSPLGNAVITDEKGLASRALNVKFDTFYSSLDGDPVSSAAVVQVRSGATALGTVNLGNFPGITLNTNTLTPVHTPPSMTAGYTTAPHTVRIAYTPGVLNVWFDNVQIFTNVAVNVAAINAANAEGKSWIGFGSRTGGYSQNNDITSWTLASTVVAPTFRITASSINVATGQGSITWLSAPSKTYRITTAPDLGAFPTTIATGIPSAGVQTTYFFSFLPGVKGFFRVEEEP